ncbi:MAG: DNA repair protein RadA [Candidatus Kapaibacteriales bacterium]
MAKSKKAYVCTNCNHTTLKWSGRCQQCGEWGTLEEQIVESKHKSIPSKNARILKAKPLDEIEYDTQERLSSGIGELDRVLGGGFMPGSLVLIGGDPGIGKSTLTLQAASRMLEAKPLYITGEESESQIKYRADRLGIPTSEQKQLYILTETEIETIASTVNSIDTEFVIIDSIQSMHTDRVDSAPGTMTQIRESTSHLMQIAKSSGKTILVIGHITKDGTIAGPKLLEHMVDAVLQFEGDPNQGYRILRSLKNRYGATGELGIFDMTEKGLSEVKNPSEVFLSDNQLGDSSGVAIVPIIEGTRPLLIEVQSLVTDTNFAVPQRTVTGFDQKRLQIILAVLEKRLYTKLSTSDVFVNIVGGISLSDPAADLAVAAAVYGSLKESIIKEKTVLLGEIGLTGEIRSVSNIERRINEAYKLGFKNIVLPRKNYDRLSKKEKGLNFIPADRVSSAFEGIFN